MFINIERIRFLSIVIYLNTCTYQKPWKPQNMTEQKQQICLVFRMQHISMQVRLSQMLMNTVVTWRPAWEVMCGEVLESSRSLPVYSHLVTYLLSSHWLPRWPPVLAVAYRHDSYCISFYIHLNHHFFCFSSLIKIERAIVVHINTYICSPWIVVH